MADDLRLGVANTTATDARKFMSASAVASVMATTTTFLLAVAAGSSTVPVVGWIGAVAATVLAGLAALVESLVSAKIKRAQAVQWAQLLGLPDPDEIPGFVVKVASMSFGDRMRLGMALQDKIAKEAGRRDPVGVKQTAKDRSRLRLVGILVVREWAQAHGAELQAAARRRIAAGDRTAAAYQALADAVVATPAPLALPPLALQARYSAWTPTVVGGMLVVTALIVAAG